MTEPWFDPDKYSWICGVAYGVAALSLGAVAFILVPKGLAKRAVVSAWVSLWSLAIVLIIVGLVAVANKQPWGVWYGILLPGIVGTAVLGGNLLIILKRYKEAERRGLPRH
jgi:hypothetical protein